MLCCARMSKPVAWLLGGACALAALGCTTDPSTAPPAASDAPSSGSAGAAAEAGSAGASAAPPSGVSQPEPSEAPRVQTPAGGLGAPAREPAGEPAIVPDAGSAADAATPVGPARVFLAGDSIVQTYADTPSPSDQAGWGQMLPEYFDATVSFENHAIGGRTARRFIDEGRLDALAAELAPGDFMLVQFGTNDGNRTATYDLDGAAIPYFLDPATDFKAYLQRYVDTARERGANPVFVTPTPRNSAYCTGGNGTGAHAAAMRELGGALSVPVVDLNARAVDYLREICPAPSPEDFFLLRADGTIDGTHFQENGARILAGFVADELVQLGLLREHRSTR